LFASFTLDGFNVKKSSKNIMKNISQDSHTYRPINVKTVSQASQWETLNPDIRRAINVVGHVLPFRSNQYVMDHLIDWSRVPDDPIFQLVFPQQAMLDADDFSEISDLLTNDAPVAILNNAINRIRMSLNPHPSGQLSHNVPELYGRKLQGMQHKYKETVLFFPSPGQTCHAYCTYCFRWAQFVGLDNLKFEAQETDDLVEYLKVHQEVTDVLITGGDPMIMRSSLLRKYIEPLLSPELEHIQNIRIGTKALAYWPQRFVSDRDADECLQLFEKIVSTGRHLAIMGHYSHPIELDSEISREAIRRVRNTGAQIRMQAPLIRHVNDNSETWVSLWKTGVSLGLIPYYMFIERDTGAQNYFEVQLTRCYEIFSEAYRNVSGLARSVRGPSMSAFPGKVRILGVLSLRDIMESHLLNTVHDRVGFDALGDPDTPMLVCDFLQARDPSWVLKPFFADFDEGASWFDKLRPAFGKEFFFFENDAKDENQHPLFELTEMLLD
jgi:KamA family protein